MQYNALHFKECVYLIISLVVPPNSGHQQVSHSFFQLYIIQQSKVAPVGLSTVKHCPKESELSVTLSL